MTFWEKSIGTKSGVWVSQYELIGKIDLSLESIYPKLKSKKILYLYRKKQVTKSIIS